VRCGIDNYIRIEKRHNDKNFPQLRRKTRYVPIAGIAVHLSANGFDFTWYSSRKNISTGLYPCVSSKYGVHRSELPTNNTPYPCNYTRVQITRSKRNRTQANQGTHVWFLQVWHVHSSYMAPNFSWCFFLRMSKRPLRVSSVLCRASLVGKQLSNVSTPESAVQPNRTSSHHQSTNRRGN